MSVVNWVASKDTAIHETQGGNGLCHHLPVASSGPGYIMNSLIGFSYSFTGISSIDSAILWLRVGNFTHSGGVASDPDLFIYRLMASWSEGSYGATDGEIAYFYAGNETVWPGPLDTLNDFVTYDVPSNTTDTWVSVDITAMVQAALEAGVFYGIKLAPVNTGAGVDNTEFWSLQKGAAYAPYIVVSYGGNTAPNVPTGLSPTGDAIVNTIYPTLAGTFSDPDVGDTQSAVQILFYADDGTTLIWDSGSVAATGATFSVAYSGSALSGNTFYKWKARSRDSHGAWGSYTSLQRFKTNSLPNAPTISISESPILDLSTLVPTFNITHSDPDPGDTLAYGYRLVVQTAGGSGVYDSGDTSTSPVTTKIISYPGTALSWQTAYKWRARTQDVNGAYGAYSSWQNFTTHTTGVPTLLAPTGSAKASSLTPTLQGKQASASDTLVSAQVQVYASNGTTLIWDSGTFSSGVTATYFSKVYAGSALSASTTYKWRALVTGSIGGTSAWSALQTFVTGSSSEPVATTPLGFATTPVTNLPFTFTRGTNFNRHELFLYSDASGSTLVTSDTPVAYGATGSKTFTYSGTLAYNTTYWWKVRVSADGGTNYSAYTGLIQFTTDSTPPPTLNAPASNAWLGAPRVLDAFDNVTSYVNPANITASTEAAIFQDGRGSVKYVLSALNGIQESYRTVSYDLSQTGSLTPIYIYSRITSLTSITYVRVRFTFATAADFAEFTITPSAANAWEQKTLTKGAPSATGGTVNWANVTRIGMRVSTAAGVSPTIYLDDLKIDSVNPAFDGTTQGGDTISLFRIIVYASDQTSVVWDSGDVAGASTTFAKLYAGSALTLGATYYWTARYTKTGGAVGDYAAKRPFILNTAPNAPTSLSPATGAAVTTTTPTFTGTFTDPEQASRGDTPTVMEVEVYRNSDSVLAYTLFKDASLSAGANSTFDGDSGVLKTTGAAAPLVNNTVYQYRMRYRDSYRAIGAWSSYNTFKPTVAPTVTISSPADAGTVTSPSFAITWSGSYSGSKTQTAYRVKIVRVTDSVTIRDTGQVASTALTYTVPAGLLANTYQYDILVYVWDSDNLVSVPDTNRVTASWTPPSVITNFAGTDDPAHSSVVLRWDVSGLAAIDFRKYVIYKKLSSDTDWAIYAEITSQATIMYVDYLAANSISYDYKITQLQVVPGDVDLESDDSAIASVILDADNWFVVGSDRADDHIFELPVSSAPFTEPVQQEVFEPLGTTRKVIVRGKPLGAEGTLEIKWMDSERVTALVQVAYLKSTSGPHLLKSPFGDVWEVEFGGPGKDYQGGGHITVTLTWTEVA